MDTSSDPAIIDVLAHLHPPATSLDKDSHAGTELEGWTVEQLKAEVLRLRAAQSQPSEVVVDSPINVGETSGSALERGKAKRQKRKIKGQAEDGVHEGQRDEEGIERDREERGKAKRVALPRDEETGKRLEKGRRPELSKVIRGKMRAALGISADEPLPGPVFFPEVGVYDIPNWNAGINDESNAQWVERIVNEVVQEAALGGCAKVPPEDLDVEVIRTATRTAFSNACKRYLMENDPAEAAKRERYVKGRRRWARKDLKQKRRLKASTDPSFLLSNPSLPPQPFHLDYMSSEYSSAGEDSDSTPEEVKVVRAERWREMLGKKVEDDARVAIDGLTEQGGKKSGWADGLGEKVLEVRRMAWRSDRLNDIYTALDGLSIQNVSARSTTPSTSKAAKSLPSDPPQAYPLAKAGHVAPSHRRFAMPLSAVRKGKMPRDGGDGWLWASGSVGVWPVRAARSADGPSEGGVGAGMGDGNVIEAGDTSGADAVEVGAALVQGETYEAEGGPALHDFGEGHEGSSWEGDTMGLVDALRGMQ